MSIKTKIAEELASRVKGGDNIAMDFASRMQRAKEQGFDRTVYHKTWGENFGDGSGFKSFSKDKMQETDYGFAGKGVYATEQPLGGTAYGDTTMKLMTNVKNPYKVKADKPDSLDPYDWIDKNADNYSSMEDASAAYTNMMKAKGYDSIIDESSGGEAVVFDQSNIRSVNAAFDPAKKDSSNLLAEMGAGIGAATTLPWMAKRAEAAEQERISAQIDESIGNMNRGQTIEAPINPYYQTAADAVGKYNRAIKGSPAEYLLGAEGLEDYLRHGAYGEADMFDRGSAALNIAELFAAPAEGLKYLRKITN